MNNLQATVGEILYTVEATGFSEINHFFPNQKFSVFNLFRSDEIERIGFFRYYSVEKILIENPKKEFLIEIESESDIERLPFVNNFSHLYYKEKIDDTVFYVFQTLEIAHFFYEEFIKKEKEKIEICFNLIGNRKIEKFQDLPESPRKEINEILEKANRFNKQNVPGFQNQKEQAEFHKKLSEHRTAYLLIAEILNKLKNEFSEEKVLVFAVDIWVARSIDVYELNKILKKNKMKIQTYCER